MKELMTIELRKLRFFGRHGLFEDEQKTGNEFEVNLSVSFIPPAGTITAITETVNYATLYELIAAEMQTPRALLETFVMEVAEQIHRSVPQVNKIEIAVTKMHPPVNKFTGATGVRYEKHY